MRRFVGAALSAFTARRVSHGYAQVSGESLASQTLASPSATYQASGDSQNGPVANTAPSRGQAQSFISAASPSFYSANRVQAHQGPQGALGGRNAAGGSKRRTTNQPSNTNRGSDRFAGGYFDTDMAERCATGPVSSGAFGRLSLQTQNHPRCEANIVPALIAEYPI